MKKIFWLILAAAGASMACGNDFCGSEETATPETSHQAILQLFGVSATPQTAMNGSATETFVQSAQQAPVKESRVVSNAELKAANPSTER